jgi:hypothetical protein
MRVLRRRGSSANPTNKIRTRSKGYKWRNLSPDRAILDLFEINTSFSSTTISSMEIMRVQVTNDASDYLLLIASSWNQTYIRYRSE